MPSLRDKYTDPELDRSDKAFDEIVNRPDMKALDDQGDAAARELERAEKSTLSSRGLDASNASDDAARSAESHPSAHPGSGLYRPDDKQRRIQGSAWSRRRKASVFGIGGGLIGLIIAGAFALLPMKLIGIMDTIVNETGQRVEQVTERRAKTILARAILTKFGSHTGVVITGEGAFSSLIASMRTSGFEKRLAAKGLVITQTPDGVRLTQNGVQLGGGKSLKNETEILNALERNNVSNKVLKQIVKEEIPSWRWMKRAKFAKWLRYKYDIPRYGILNNSEEPNDEKRAQEMQKGRLSTMYGRTVKNALDAFDCLLGSKCVADNLGGSTKGDLPSSDDVGEATGDIEAAADTLTDESAKDPFKVVSTKIPTIVLDKLGTKTIPIIGWIDLVATLDHIAWEALENDYFAKIPAYFRALQYAQIFGEWSGYSDQQKLGALDHAMNGPLANQLDGAETSQAFSYIEGDASRGEPIKLKVDSNDPSKYKEFWEGYKDATNGIPGTPGGFNTHDILNAYYETIGGGGLLGFLGDKLGSIIGSIAGFLTPESVEKWLGEVVKKGLSKVMDYFGLTIDPLDSGPDLFNNIHAGGTVSFNEYCKEIGCRKLSADQANAANTQIAAQRSNEAHEKGVFYAMFSPEYTESITSKFAISLPSVGSADISTFATKFSAMVSNAPANMLGALTPRAAANTNYVDLYGVDPYGATEADLNNPLSLEFIEGDSCPDVAEGAFDSCKVDTEVAEGMLCEFEPESDACIDESQPPRQKEELDFTVASYNIQHLQFRGNYEERTQKQVQIILGTATSVSNPQFDIFGTQETSPEQFELLKKSLSGYEAFPKDTNGMHPGAGAHGSLGIFWNTAKFTLASSGHAPAKSNTSESITAPWVELKTASGRSVFVISVHYATASNGGNGTAIKEASALTMKWVAEKARGNAIAVVVGDFNDRLSEKNSYCVYTENGLMQHAVDMEKGVSAEAGCTKFRYSGIDHVYATPNPNLSIKEWAAMSNSSFLDSASDHGPVYATYSISGEDSPLGGLTVATYNVKVPGQTDLPNDGWEHSSVRMPLISQIIKDNAVDVVGFQEVEPSTFRLLSDNMPEYDNYPRNAASAVGKSWMDPIFWVKADFDLVDKGEFKRSYRLCPGVQLCDDAVWVRLRHKASNSEFYFMSLHMVNRNPYVGPNKSDNGGAEKREADSKEVVRVIKEKFESGVPVFFVGDLNSSWDMAPTGDDAALNGNRNRLPYCILTKDNLLINSYDSVEGKSGYCPSPNRPYEVDHIYATPDIKFAKSKQVKNQKTNTASDHDPIVAKVAASSSGSGTVGDWVWPLGLQAFKAHRSDFLGSHYAGGGFLGNGNSSVDISWGSSDTGAPIYSMLTGEVKIQPLGRSGRQCSGTPNGDNNGGMMIESVVNGKVVQIAYAHGTNPEYDVGDRVEAGKQILKLGNVGNSCESHLHMDMTYGGKNICVQDVFLALEKKQQPNLELLTTKSNSTCSGRL